MPDALFASLSIAAMLLSPWVALQIRARMEERKENRRRKEWIFKTLMGTRATTVSIDHVNALNLIDLDFGDKRNKYKAVLNAWEAYRDHLGDSVALEQGEAWATKRLDLLVRLLLEMGHSLGYSFNEVQIRRGVYYPRALGDIEEKRLFVLNEVCKILKGDSELPMFAKVVDITNNEINRLQDEVRRLKEEAKDPNAS